MVCTKPAQFILMTFNITFLTFGICLFGIGIWSAVDPSLKAIKDDAFPEASVDLMFVSGLLIAVGMVTFSLGLIGFLGAMKKNRCLLSTYFILLLVLLLTKLVGLCVIFAYKNTFEIEFKSQIEQLFKKSLTNSTSASHIEHIEVLLQCCGINGKADYTQKGAAIPDSCYQANTNETYSIGCYNAAMNKATANLPVIFGVLFVIIFIELMAILFSICICSKSKDNKYEDL